MQSPEATGPVLCESFSKRPYTGISKRVGVLTRENIALLGSSLRKTHRRPSSCVCTFHPGSGARPVNTRFCLPRHRPNLVSGIKMACTDFPPPNRLRHRHTRTQCYKHNEEVGFVPNTNSNVITRAHIDWEPGEKSPHVMYTTFFKM